MSQPDPPAREPRPRRRDGERAPRGKRSGENEPRERVDRLTAVPPGTVIDPALFPSLPPAVAEELGRVTTRVLDARWFLGHALAALTAGDLSEAQNQASLAKQAAPRSPSVREVCGVVSYLRGEFKDASSDLLSFRRQSGSPIHDARIADCYRALGRPLRAVQFLDEADTRGPAATLVRAGSLRDAGDPAGAEAALRLGKLPGVVIPDPGFLPAGAFGSAARAGKQRIPKKA